MGPIMGVVSTSSPLCVCMVPSRWFRSTPWALFLAAIWQSGREGVNGLYERGAIGGGREDGGGGDGQREGIGRETTGGDVTCTFYDWVGGFNKF